MLLLPTGVGGVLYRPRFFNHSVAFSRELFSHTLRADDLTFRLATLANKVYVYTACVHGDYKDHKLITKCPVLPGVGFQHIARRLLRRLDVGAVGSTNSSSSSSSIGGGSGGSLRGSIGSSALRYHNSTSTSTSGGGGGHNDTAHSRGGDSTSSRGHYSAPSVGVYNRSRLALEVHVTPPTKNIDHGKQGSLSGINSKHDGNYHQWNKATEFLKAKNLFDVDAFIQPFVTKERHRCLVTSALLNYDNSTWLGSVVGTVATNLQVIKESFHESRCAVVTCHGFR
jgi:hypothetical protein